MNINELKPAMGNIELTAEIVDIGQIREFNKSGKSGRVATAKLKDGTGEIALSLWNEQIDQFSTGDAVKVSNGYAKEYQGELQLTTGMRGTIELVRKGEKKEASQEAPKPEPAESKPYTRPPLDEESIEDD